MESFILTFLFGLIFGLLLFKLKVPGGMMVGAIIGSTVLNVIFDNAYMPNYAKIAAQITAGAFIGCSVDKSDLIQLKNIVKPMIIVLISLLILNIFIGFIIYFISPLDLVTSLMCCVPGGISDTPIIAADMGADSSKVVAMQFARLVMGLGLFQTLISITNKRFVGDNVEISNDKTQNTKKVNNNSKKQLILFLVTLIIASICGIIGKYTKIPGGILLFSMIGVTAFKLIYGKAYLPMWAKRIAQVLAGTYVGSSIGVNEILELRYIVVPTIILILGYILNCIIVGSILYKKYNFSLKEAMLAATPAGASDMALISGDLGVDSANLVVMQIIRLLVVVAVFPQIIYLIVLYFG